MQLGTILALDLGVRTGYCHGPRGFVPPKGIPPVSGKVRLKTKDEGADAAYCQLLRFLSQYLNELHPLIVVKEAMLPLQAFSNLGNAEHTVNLTRGLHAIVEGMCKLHGYDWKNVADSTIRKNFIGQARMGTRDETKRAVLQRARLLGYLPQTCDDCDRADAVAVWHWAAHMPPDQLFLFGEGHSA